MYLADRRYDMLPSLLSTDLCSLWSGKERCAVSALWEMDQNCSTKKAWYGRSVIRSAYKLTYEVWLQLGPSEVNGLPSHSELVLSSVATPPLLLRRLRALPMGLHSLRQPRVSLN